MPERKVWTEDEDKILRHLRQERKEKKWASIARIMEQEFTIQGRTGKQCRERYHNHLDSAIVNTEWTQEQEEMLFDLHQELGNKWSAISQKIPGRSDNCVKNHFYSKLRKAMRKLNKIIQDIYSVEYGSIKSCILSKIIQITESKFKANSKEDEDFVEHCNDIKNRLFRLEVSDLETMDQEELFICKELIEDIELFDRDYRKNHKSSKKYAAEGEYKIYLKPPKPLIKRQNSNGSCSSDVSDDNSSFLSSVSCISSCSDLSEYDISEKKNQSCGNSTRSIKASPAGSSENIKLEHQEQEHRNEAQDPAQFQKEHEGLIEEERQSQFVQNDLKLQGYEYNNMFYDDTPVISRIFGPSYSNMDEQPDSVLFRCKESDSEEIAYAEQKQDK